MILTGTVRTGDLIMWSLPADMLLTEYTLNLPNSDLTVYKSLGSPNWWSASNLCQSYGLQLVTMADLGISDPDGKAPCYFDHEKADNDGKSVLKCTCSGDDTDCSQTVEVLYNIFGTSGYLWLADNSKTNSCRALGVSLSGGFVKDYSRNGYAYALCR